MSEMWRAFAGRFVAALIVSTMVVVLTIGAAFTFASNKVRGIDTVEIDGDVLEGGRNFLLIGSDTREFVDSSEEAEHFGSAQEQTGQRSDTIMIAHVEPGGAGGFIVSIPRDLWVDIPQMGESKINAAFNAGPQRVIETIEQNFNVPIGHYLEVDFAGFHKIVDAIGSVPIYFPAPARDVKSGLLVDDAGCQRLGGDQALAYVRSRFYEYLENGEWRADPTSDLGRIRRQQYFMRTLAHEVMDTSARRPWKANQLLDSVLSSLSRDPELRFSDLRSLGRMMRGPDGVPVEMTTLPVRPERIGGQDALVLDDAPAQALFARLRSDDADGEPRTVPDIPPSSVTVSVQNATSRGGLGAITLEGLRAQGFSAVGPASNGALDDDSTTEVRHRPDDEDKAQLVLAYLGGAGRLAPIQPADGDADVVVVLGRDFEQVRAPRTTVPAPAPSATGAPAPGATSATTTPPAPSAAPFPVVGCQGAPI
jgi:LCP family protein required for cell wall assembly